MKLVGERLQFERLTGTGPETGWARARGWPKGAGGLWKISGAGALGLGIQVLGSSGVLCRFGARQQALHIIAMILAL